jgi:hypothetical protein
MEHIDSERVFNSNTNEQNVSFKNTTDRKTNKILQQKSACSYLCAGQNSIR